MADSNFGIMELLQKLLKERGGAISDKEMGIMSGATETGKTGSGYESWLDKNRFDRDETSNYKAGEMQILDPLANTTQVGNATTPALDKMRSYSGVISGGGNPANWKGSDNRFGQQSNWGEPDAHGVNNPFTQSYNRGAVSNNELQNFKIASQYVDDGALSGWMAHKIPLLDSYGVSNIDLNVPPREIRNQINAMTAQPRGAMSGNEMDRGNPSNVDRSFAQALGALSDREQAEIISATQGMTTDEQIDNFKRQYLQGRISPYELEMQSNLGF